MSADRFEDIAGAISGGELDHGDAVDLLAEVRALRADVERLTRERDEHEEARAIWCRPARHDEAVIARGNAEAERDEAPVVLANLRNVARQLREDGAWNNAAEVVEAACAEIGARRGEGPSR